MAVLLQKYTGIREEGALQRARETPGTESRRTSECLWSDLEAKAGTA